MKALPVVVTIYGAAVACGLAVGWYAAVLQGFVIRLLEALP